MWNGKDTRPRVMTYVRRDPRLLADQNRPFQTRDILWLTINDLTIVNFYRQNDERDALDTLFQWSVPERCLVAGDFNGRQARARLLLDVSLERVSRDYYIVQKSHVRRDLEQFLLNKTPIDTLSKCKLHALFAIGEVYMARSFVSKSTLPGMNHFIMAKRALQMVGDEPQIGMIELQLLLSYYCLFLNQLRSAYTQAGYAIQLALIMGLHRDTSDNGCDGVAMREHRHRVWWTVCTFDRMRACATGLPISVPDDPVEVDRPVEPRLMSAMQDFEDFAYVKAQVQLSKLTFTAMNAVHQRKHDVFVQAQALDFLARLRNWVNSIPPLLQFSTESIPSCDRPLNLRLSFNQSVICITRPLWNYVVLPTSLSLTSNPPCSPQNTYLELSLLEAGIECAQQTCKFLIELWIHGSFLTFDCVYTRYLFSALTILLLAYMLNDEEYSEVRGQSEVAAHILTQLKESGNALAAEYCLHIDGIRRLMRRHETVLGIGSDHSTLNDHTGVDKWCKEKTFDAVLEPSVLWESLWKDYENLWTGGDILADVDKSNEHLL
ncbi:hypothetical protein FOMA001_g18303 [Fusarium oxysporum f. sp. matthiolae]|nr:hypothetical protein FOMA001_g18303 [Fusarium oxysporum f. sp. matthiolae]